METKQATISGSRIGFSRIILMAVLCFLLLWVARSAFINYFDSGITRYACLNHARYLTDLEASDSPTVLSDEQIRSLGDQPIEWRVERHIRSNKLGLIDRDSASCTLASNVAGLESREVAMSDAETGSFYFFGKFAGIMLQVGLVSSFIRWFHYRFNTPT